MGTDILLAAVTRKLRAGGEAAATDDDLLARYARDRDAAAFEALVSRYGGLVLGVARRQLADRHLAEDVFQATFLAVARSAGRFGPRASLPNWLYTVTLRLARKARKSDARRAEREQAARAVPRDPADPLAEISGRELLTLIDEEIARLPERFRLPVLLCCVQGLTRDEAARRLGCSASSVKGRLERGRRRLADRLAARGVPQTAVALAGLTSVTVPPALLASAAAAPWSVSLPVAVLALAAAAAGRRVLPSAALVGSLLVAGLATLIAATGGPPASGRALPLAAETPVTPAADPLPAGGVVRLGTDRYRLGPRIEVLAVSADGTRAAAAGGGEARVFDLADGRVLYTIDSNRWVEAAAFSPDGKTLATREGNTLVLRDAATGRERDRTALPPAECDRTVTGWLTFTPDGGHLAATSRGREVHLVDVRTGGPIRTFAHVERNLADLLATPEERTAGRREVVYACAFTPDGRLMAAGGYDHERGTYFARLSEVESGKEIRRFAVGDGTVRALAFSPDGATLAGGGDDGRLRLWDAATGKERRVFPRAGDRVRSVAFAPDGKTVAAAGAAVRLYDPATGVERLRIDRQASGLRFTPDGAVLSGAAGGAVCRWDASTGRPLTPMGQDCAVEQILATPDGRRVFVRDADGDLHLWDPGSGRHLRRVPAGAAPGGIVPGADGRRLVPSPDGRGLLPAGAEGGVVRSPDGRLLAWAAADDSVKAPYPAHAEWGLYHGGSRVRLYDLVTDRVIDRFPIVKDEAAVVGFLPDGRTLLTLDPWAAVVRVWNVATGAEVRSFPVARRDDVRSYSPRQAALSPDGRTLAVGYERADDGLHPRGVPVRLWDVAAGTAGHELAGHTNTVDTLAFSPDGRLLVTGREAGAGGAVRDTQDRVYVWDVGSGRRVPALSDGLPVGAGRAAFAPDGRTLATASADGVVRVWEVASWKVRAEFRGHRGRVSALGFGPDGRLFTGGIDTTVLGWEVRPPRPAAGQPLAAAWDELAAPDPVTGFRAQGRFLADREAVGWLAARVEPAVAPDPARVKALVADLSADDFAARERATAALRELGPLVAGALREVVEKSPSPEARHRAGRVLGALASRATPPGELRALRAAEVLEWVGTPEARRLLGELAKGTADAPLTRDAAAALKRLEARK